jgi:hypothetical protein
MTQLQIMEVAVETEAAMEIEPAVETEAEVGPDLIPSISYTPIELTEPPVGSPYRPKPLSPSSTSLVLSMSMYPLELLTSHLGLPQPWPMNIKCT